MREDVIKTPPFRLSFPALDAPKANMDGKIRFRAEMLLPKQYTAAHFQPFFNLYNLTIPDTWKRGLPNNPEQWRSPRGWQVKPVGFIDGDTKKQAERHGYWILRATSGPDYPPRVLLSERDPLTGGFMRGTEREVYAGCWCVALLTAYSFDHEKGSAGVAFNLHTIQKVQDGEKFSNALSEDEADDYLAA